MPRVSKKAGPAVSSSIRPIPRALLAEVVRGPMSTGKVKAICHSFRKVLIERLVGAELRHHRAYREGPNDETACKLLWLALQNVVAKKNGSPHDWREAMNQFVIFYGERFTQRSA